MASEYCVGVRVNNFKTDATFIIRELVGTLFIYFNLDSMSYLFLCVCRIKAISVSTNIISNLDIHVRFNSLLSVSYKVHKCNSYVQT